MFPMKRVAVAAGLLAAASSLSPAAATPVPPAGTPAISIGSTGTDGSSAATRGWSFTLGNEINVTALGFYDNQLNGLVDSHQVGIWDVSGTLLVTGTVSSGTLSPLTSQFRYTTTLSGTTDLLPGDYRLGGLGTLNDQSRRGVLVSDTTTASGVTYIGSLSNGNAGTFSDPTTPTTDLGYDVGYFGPNFQFTPVAVPEPGPLGILAVAGLCMGLLRRRVHPPG
jgi:hypothetical protein